MLRLGFFREFKFEGEDMVLLTGTNEDIRVLNDRIGAALSNSLDVVALHDLASVAPNHKLEIFAVLKSLPKAHANAATFFWRCFSEEFPQVEGKLSALMNCRNGHHYFDLEGSNVTLMVSVGEYSDEWWQMNG